MKTIEYSKESFDAALSDCSKAKNAHEKMANAKKLVFLENLAHTDAIEENSQMKFEAGMKALLQKRGWDQKAPNAETEKEKILREELGLFRATGYDTILSAYKSIKQRIESPFPLGYPYGPGTVKTDKKWLENIEKLFKV